MNFNIILAVDSKNGIGKNSTLPWNFSDDFVQKYILSVSNYASIVELGLRLLNSIIFICILI